MKISVIAIQAIYVSGKKNNGENILILSKKVFI